MSQESIHGLWNRHVTLIVTGASKGFGRAMVAQFLQSFGDYHEQAGHENYSITLVLSARDENTLDQFIAELKISFPKINRIEKVIGSLEDESTFKKFQSVFESVLPGTDQVILVHNAGSLGDPSKLVGDYAREDFPSLSSYFNSNVTSVMTLTAIFLKIFERVKSKMIVNVSSLAAITPLKGLSLYCTGKAARDAYFRSVALEYGLDVRTINYAPGPLKTAMAEELRLNSHMKEFFEDPKNILDPEDSAAKLVKILIDDNYINGSHVDYYDAL